MAISPSDAERAALRSRDRRAGEWACIMSSSRVVGPQGSAKPPVSTCGRVWAARGDRRTSANLPVGRPETPLHKRRPSGRAPRRAGPASVSTAPTTPAERRAGGRHARPRDSSRWRRGLRAGVRSGRLSFEIKAKRHVRRFPAGAANSRSETVDHSTKRAGRHAPDPTQAHLTPLNAILTRPPTRARQAPPGAGMIYPMSDETVTSFQEGHAACPFVAFEDDRDHRADHPDYGHRCFAAAEPEPRALPHQERFCLSAAFAQCPIFLDWARQEAAGVATKVPLRRRRVSPRRRPRGRPPSSRRPSLPAAAGRLPPRQVRSRRTPQTRVRDCGASKAHPSGRSLP